MASVRPTPAGKFELTIKHRLLPKRVYLTFDTEREAAAYGDQAAALLGAGIVPVGLVPDGDGRARERVLLANVLREWINTGQPAATDMDVLALLVGDVGALPIDGFTYGWCEQWVSDMKLLANYAPGTIRKRVASLARAVDWFMKKHPAVPLQNPLRMLPRGAATYNAADARKLAADPRNTEQPGKIAPKVDTERDRRLDPSELRRIMDALDGVKRPDRERPMRPPHARALRALFLLILHTGLRLREAYTLTVGQFDLQRRVVRARASKQWHGREKFREVPMTAALHAELADYLAGADPAALAFPWWDGDRDLKAMAKVSTRLSNQFARVFEYAQVLDFTEHDLRHETTCRWYEMRRPDGAWVLSEREIDRIMGWAPGSKMAARYASFRADDLAARVWATGQVAEAA